MMQADVRQLAAVVSSGAVSSGAVSSGAVSSGAVSSGAVVIDVREPYEYASGHVPGALSIPMHLVPLRMDEIPSNRDVYVICAAGNRSWQVCHYLGQRGIEAINVTGGTQAWALSGLPIDTTPAADVAAGANTTNFAPGFEPGLEGASS